MRDPDGDHGRPEAKAASSNETSTIGRIKRRADFLRAAKGRRWHGKAFSLQVSRPEDISGPQARVGFTVTKKVGNAVIRNRARRRLREAIRLHHHLPVCAGHDYVLVARLEALRLPFATLQADLVQAVRSVHADARPPRLAKGRAREADAPPQKSDAVDKS